MRYWNICCGARVYPVYQKALFGRFKIENPSGEKGKKFSCKKNFLNLLGNIGETVVMLKDLIARISVKVIFVKDFR